MATAKTRFLKLECRVCGTRNKIAYRGPQPVKEDLEVLKDSGWIVDFMSRKKSLCPSCNMFYQKAGVLV